jgi:hypothetical protein
MYNIHVQYILLSQIWDQVLAFISPRNRVARLHPQALGISVLSPLLTDESSYKFALYRLDTDCIEDTLRTRILAIPLLLLRCVYVAVLLLPAYRFHKNVSRCLAAEVHVAVWTVFPRSNAGIVVRIPIEAWMSLCVYSVFVLGSGIGTGWSLVQGVLPMS